MKFYFRSGSAILACLVLSFANVNGACNAGQYFNRSSCELAPIGFVANAEGSLTVCPHAIYRGAAICQSTTVMVSTAMGGGTQMEGNANSIFLNNPWGVASDAEGNVYVADTYNYVIKELNATTGQVKIVAGENGVSGFIDGKNATSSLFYNPQGLFLHEDGKSLFVADTMNRAVRVVVPSSNTVETTGAFPEDKDYGIYGIVVDSDTGIVYTTETYYVSRFEYGQRYVVAGTGHAGVRDGKGTEASFFVPTGIALISNSQSGGQGTKLIIADSNNNLIRMVDATDGTTTTIAGVALQPGYQDGPVGTAKFYYPYGVAVSPKTGEIYVGDTWNHVIRIISADGTQVSTLAGTPGKAGSANGAGSVSSFNQPHFLATSFDGSKIYVADYYNGLVRVVDLGGASSCEAGHHFSELQQRCEPAPAGYFKPLVAASDIYYKCDKGYYSLEGAVQCTSCGISDTEKDAQVKAVQREQCSAYFG